MFSFVFLLKTLFAPWKNITDTYPSKGFDLSLMLQTWMFNMITRLIGFVIRFVTLLIGVLVQIGLLVGFVVYLMLWLLYPLLALLGLLFLIGIL